MGVLSVIKNVPKVAKRGLGRVLFSISKNKPQILLGGGIILTVGGFVWAVVNATKLNDTMSEGEKAVNDIQEKIKIEEGKEEVETTLVDLNKELRKAKKDNIMKVAFLMGAPTLVFVGGVAMTVGGHIILLRRFGQVSASLAALQQAFARYRQMNIAEHGEECDRRYRYGISNTIETESVITDENGNEVKGKALIPVTDKDPASMFTFIFSEEFSRKCPKDPVATISFLKSQEKYWNMWMQATGRPVTLSMVLQDLGIELDPDDPMNDYILVAGWRPNGEGDGYIDFGIMRSVNKPTLDMLENSVMLNFNCDGNIYHSVRTTKDGKKVC